MTEAHAAPHTGNTLKLVAAAGALAFGAFAAVVLRPHDPGEPPKPEPPRRAASIAASIVPSKPARSVEPATPARALLGKRIFFDESLSEPKGTSCASCHEPALGFAGVHGSKLGVALGSRHDHYARRNTPSLLYLKYVRPFHFHWEEDAPLPDGRGGFFWDGRSDSIAELVRQPLLNPDEMGNTDAAMVSKKLLASAYAAELRTEFGDALSTPDGALKSLGRALESYLLSDAMAPFSSKYDDYLRGKVKLDEFETRGLALFKNPERGNCASCHRLNDRIPNPERSLFSDYGYEAVAVPRNRHMPRNRNAKEFDLGVCERHEPGGHTDEERLCGSFRTPSLRNVALRPSFMHNGVFSSLRDVVAFYATRGTETKRWYPSGAAFDDLPSKYHKYVKVDRPPYDRGAGEKPRLDDADIDAIVAFLNTLSDVTQR
ncbi:MAG TPA: cytochrome c peroxidase [Polyangiaceae bacterium]|nr:cytochrome c peroxidase [Polyangiaceae bacterium]